MVGGDSCIFQLIPQFFKGGCVLFSLGLRLKQRDGTNIFSGFLIFRLGPLFQIPAQINGVNQHLPLLVPVIDDHWQLDHALGFQLHRVNIRDNVALLFGCSGQIQHKAGVEVCQHFQTEIGTGVVALVHNHQRIELIDDLKQGGFVSVLNGIFRLAQYFGKLRQIAVFLIGFQPLFAAATEGVVG